MTTVIGFVIFLISLGLVWGVYLFTLTERIEKELRSKYGLDEVFVSMEDQSFVGIKFAKKQVILGKGRGKDTRLILFGRTVQSISKSGRHHTAGCAHWRRTVV